MSKDVETLTQAVALEIAALREAIVGNTSQWANALRVRGARPLQISRAAVTPVLWNGDGRLMGWSLRVDAAATGPATITLRDGDADGDILASFTVAVGSSSTHLLPGGVSVGRALVATVTGTAAATVVGAVFFLD